MTITAEELRSLMAQCTGTEQYHRVTMLPLNATDGVRMVAEKAGAFWLFDAIASYQLNKKIRGLSIQFWFLEVKDNETELYCIEDTGKPKIVSQKIQFTDFPTGIWEFYVTNNVIMLKNEY